jgi:hypothetical protein
MRASRSFVQFITLPQPKTFEQNISGKSTDPIARQACVGAVALMCV